MRYSKIKKKDCIIALLALAGAALMVLPFLWMFTTSMCGSTEAFRLPPHFFPDRVDFTNYIAVFNSEVPVLLFAFNSFKIAAVVTIGQLFTCSIAAYAFAKLKFPGRDVLFIILLFGLMVPVQVTIIPVFIGMSRLGLVDTHLSLILPGLCNAFGVFLLRQWFLTVPNELLESGKMDGAGNWTIFRRVALPQAGPALSALVIITFNGQWNNYFVPLVFINSWEKMTLPLGVASLRSYFGNGNLPVVMAFVSIAVIPVLLIFIFMQRYFIEGLAMSGIKA
jgi:ABC-type sugar transport system, permease component